MYTASITDATCINACYYQDMRTTVSLPDPILDNTKKYAEEHGITVSVVIEDALRRFLSKDRSTAPPPFQLHTFRGAANSEDQHRSHIRNPGSGTKSRSSSKSPSAIHEDAGCQYPGLCAPGGDASARALRCLALRCSCRQQPVRALGSRDPGLHPHCYQYPRLRNAVADGRRLSLYRRLGSPSRLHGRPPPVLCTAVSSANSVCEKPGIHGNLVADAAHAPLAIESGCDWITADTDFARFAPTLRWQHL